MIYLTAVSPGLTKNPHLAVQSATSSYLSGNRPASAVLFSDIVQDSLDIACHPVEKAKEISGRDEQ